MSYKRWATKENSPWYAWGGGEDDGPLVLALWHHNEDHPVHITSEEAEAIMRGEVWIQNLFNVVLTPRELQEASRIVREYLDDVAEDAKEQS